MVGRTKIFRLIKIVLFSFLEFSLGHWMQSNQVSNLPLSNTFAELLKSDLGISRFFGESQCQKNEPYFIVDTDLGWKLGMCFIISHNVGTV